jgi:hypothetical protein
VPPIFQNVFISQNNVIKSDFLLYIVYFASDQDSVVDEKDMLT